MREHVNSISSPSPSDGGVFHVVLKLRILLLPTALLIPARPRVFSDLFHTSDTLHRSAQTARPVWACRSSIDMGFAGAWARLNLAMPGSAGRLRVWRLALEDRSRAERTAVSQPSGRAHVAQAGAFHSGAS
jgi:hypothetical protein